MVEHPLCYGSGQRNVAGFDEPDVQRGENLGVAPVPHPNPPGPVREARWHVKPNPWRPAGTRRHDLAAGGVDAHLQIPRLDEVGIERAVDVVLVRVRVDLAERICDDPRGGRDRPCRGSEHHLRERPARKPPFPSAVPATSRILFMTFSVDIRSPRTVRLGARRGPRVVEHAPCWPVSAWSGSSASRVDLPVRRAACRGHRPTTLSCTAWQQRSASVILSDSPAEPNRSAGAATSVDKHTHQTAFCGLAVKDRSRGSSGADLR